MKEIQTPRPGEIYIGSDNGLYQIICTAIDASNLKRLIIFQELQGGFNTYALASEKFTSAVLGRDGTEVPMFKRVAVHQDGSIEEIREGIQEDSNEISYKRTSATAETSNLYKTAEAANLTRSGLDSISTDKPDFATSSLEQSNNKLQSEHKTDAGKPSRKLVLNKGEAEAGAKGGSAVEDNLYRIKEFDELEGESSISRELSYSRDLIVKFFDAKTDAEKKQILKNNKLKFTQRDLDIIYEAFELNPFEGGRIFQIEGLISYLDTRMKFEGS